MKKRKRNIVGMLVVINTIVKRIESQLAQILVGNDCCHWKRKKK